MSLRVCSLGALALATSLFSACATSTTPQINGADGGLGDSGGMVSSAGMATGGTANAAGGDSAAGSSTAGSSSGGMSSGTAGSGVVVGGSSGMSSGGTAGSGVAGSGTAGSAVAGSSTGGTGTAGSGTAGSGTGGTTGTAGSGTAGSGTAGSGTAGAGGTTSTINPCNRKNWVATASAFSDSTTEPALHNPPAFGIDGDQATRWSTGADQAGGEWYKVDLGARATHLTQVVLDTSKDAADCPKAYKLELSDDGNTWTQVATGAGAATTTVNFTDHGARYIRATQTGVNAAQWWTIHELSITCTP